MGQVQGSTIRDELKEKSSVKSALSKVTAAWEVCIKFKEAYFEYKA